MAGSFYSEEEAQEILKLAARRSGYGEGMSRDRLIEAAAELGISADDVISAEAEIRNRASAVLEREQFVQHRKRQFLGSIFSTAGMCVLLFGINFLTDGGFVNPLHTWAIWPCGFFLIHTISEGIEWAAALTAAGDEAFEKWREKRGKKTGKAGKGVFVGIKIGNEESTSAPEIANTGSLPPLPLPELARRALEQSGGSRAQAIEIVYRTANCGLTEAIQAVSALDNEVHLNH